MSLSPVHTCGVAAPQATPAPTRRTEPREHEDESRHGQHRHAGALRDALGEAFQSLGIDLPQRQERGHRHEDHHRHRDDDGHDDEHHGERRALPVGQGAGPSTPVAAEGSEPPDDESQASAPASPVTVRTVRSDLHDFMHELVQAARSAYAATTASRPAGEDAAAAGSPPAAPGVRLAIGLSALVSQVSAGQTPPALQGAFDQLMSDAAALRGGSTPTPEEGTPASAAPTLQQVLGALQQRLGYGSSANDGAAMGNTIDLAA